MNNHVNGGRGDTVTEVIDGRRGVYGDPVEMFARAAQIWSGILGVEVKATDVPLMLIGYKTLRSQVTPDYSDNSDDIEGYLDIFRELVGEDMVHARSVTEYLAAIQAKCQPSGWEPPARPVLHEVLNTHQVDNGHR